MPCRLDVLLTLARAGSCGQGCCTCNTCSYASVSRHFFTLDPREALYLNGTLETTPTGGLLRVFYTKGAQRGGQNRRYFCCHQLPNNRQRQVARCARAVPLPCIFTPFFYWPRRGLCCMTYVGRTSFRRKADLGYYAYIVRLSPCDYHARSHGHFLISIRLAFPYECGSVGGG